MDNAQAADNNPQFDALAQPPQEDDSWEDSERFEEDSLGSWYTDPESLCQNWRGWTAAAAGGSGGNFAGGPPALSYTGFGGDLALNPVVLDVAPALGAVDQLDGAESATEGDTANEHAESTDGSKQPRRLRPTAARRQQPRPRARIASLFDQSARCVAANFTFDEVESFCQRSPLASITSDNNIQLKLAKW